MIKEDIEQLNELERRLLNSSFDPEASRRRLREIVVVALVVAAGVIIALIAGVSPMATTVLFLAYLWISAAEKASYTTTILSYKSLIRKLVRRVERLEGVPLTSEGTNAVRRALHQEHPAESPVSRPEHEPT